MAVTPLNFAGLTIPPASAINAAASPRTLAGAGARSLIPLTYGTDRVTGLILNVLLASAGSSTLLVQVLWGHACSAVSALRLNDKVLSGGSSATNYTGSQVTAHAALVTAFAAQGITYAEALTGYAYSVIAMPAVEFDGQLNFTALIDGRNLYDPRLDSTNGGSGSHRLATPSTWAFSSSPSLALADWLYSSVYGANSPPLWSSVITAANANDALIGSPSETHRTIGVTFSGAVQVPEMAEALRAYAGVWLVPTSGGIKLLPDATASSVATYAHASGQIAGIDALTLRDLGNSPTAVEVVYTDTSQIPYRDASAIAQLSGAGTTLPWRQSTVRLPGVQRYGQALREATERLNKLTLSDLSTTLEVFDGGIAHEAGDVVTVSHPVGLVSKLFRVSGAPQMAGPGKWRLPLAEYDPAVYSAAVATAPTYSDSGLNISDSVTVWSDVTGRPALFRVASRGFSDLYRPIEAGLYNGETGAGLYGAVRSYNFARIRRSDGVVTFQQTYDVYGAGASTSGRDAAALATALDATGSSDIVVLWGFDEPKALRLTGGLEASMYRCGASRAVFGSPQFKANSAYILVGIGGCGEGNGFEAYNGAVDGDTSAWCDVAFTLQAGQLIVTGTTAVPRTLADHGYSGDLDATNGATFGINIAGQATSADIAANAVSALTSAYTAANLSMPTEAALYTVQTLNYQSSNAANEVALNGGFILNVSGGGSGAGTVEVRLRLYDSISTTQIDEVAFTLIGTSGTTISGTYAVSMPEYVWQPSTAARTAVLYAYWAKTGSYTGATVSVQARSLSARERKK